MRDELSKQLEELVSRRRFLAASGVAAASMSLAAMPNSAHAMSGKPRTTGSNNQAPFESLRDYLAAMEDHGLLVRFDKIDQDAYEGTAIMYYLADTFGAYGAPVVLFENVKQDGRWIKGPIIANNQSHYHQEALMWGLEIDPIVPENSYRAGLKYMMSMLEANGGDYPQIPPVQVAREQAPCKEITLTGDEIDITNFAFIQGNPGDAGRYINTASCFTYDPEWQQNFGTYRCQIISARKIILNSEPNQTANRMILRAIKRGETMMPVAFVLGQDPVTWMVSGSRVPLTFKKPIDELAYVGGMRGKALEVVKCDDSSLIVPAHSELVIEGVIDLINTEPEGPYHETYGYLGDRNEARFAVRINKITHRKNPILMNSFTSIGGGFVKAPMDAYNVSSWQKKYPQITGIFYHDDTKGVYFVSIKKDKPGLGKEIANAISKRSFIAKVVVVVDDDLDIMNQAEMWLALGSRWQPAAASDITESAKASFFEPSAVDGRTSKIAIDATIQWPEEGGPKDFPALNRNLFEAKAPDAVKKAVIKWADKIQRKPF
ncbi:UbiD family decarboxylase [Oceanicoccus sp. KOV_DT_Chl]|uniref:UbiD family decarboxylase n=1 Tax=Oceanicoccus sp. KOV_DT_Chl TaxID=1904639 RepID=UPI000C7B0D91|nr:UbiD family decarboxylase [Oceanicoccus sp. KOV_DT_Chl]